jgi:hypothetical protein
VVALRTEELDDMRKQIADGKLPADAIQKYLADEEKAVFGFDFKRDRHGKPIEQGIGSAAQPSENSVKAYELYGRDEPDYQTNLARMRKELAEHQKRRAERRAT